MRHCLKKTGIPLITWIVFQAHLAFAAPEAREQPTRAAYLALGVPPTASSEEIQTAYQSKIKDSSLGEEARSRIAGSYALLSNPDLKKQYDEGSPLRVAINTADREKLAELIEPVNPNEAARLRDSKETKLTASVDTLGNAASFYTALGIMEATKSFHTKDPTGTKAFWEDSKDPTSLAGMGLFLATAQLSTSVAGKYLGKGFTGQTTAGFFGLLVGSVANEAFLDFAKNPESEAYWKARHIKDPGERAARQKEALQKLGAKTFQNKDWYLDKAPGLATLGVGFAGSTAALIALNKGLEHTIQGVRTYQTTHGASNTTHCVAAFLEGSLNLLNAPGWTGLSKFTHKRSMEVANLILFTAIANASRDKVNQGWDILTLDRNLSENRDQLVENVAHYKENPNDDLEKNITSSLKVNMKLWDTYRRKKLSEIEPVMSQHAKDLDQFDQSIKKPHDFYQWFVDGMNPEDQNWKSIQSKYYDPYTTPDQAKKDISKYLHSFYCGPSAAESFTDSANIHGVPVPGRLNITVENYRVVSAVDPAVCQMSDDKLQKKLLSEDHITDLRKARAKLLVASQASRNERIDLFEKRVEKDILRIFEAPSIQKTYKFPNGVLPAFDVQLEDLKNLGKTAGDSPVGKKINEKIAVVQQERQAAQNALDYYKTPTEKRMPIDKTFIDLIRSTVPSDDEDWKNTAAYFDGYIER